MKKERLFYLDFIRAIAIIFVVLAHFNAYLIYNLKLDNIILFYEYQNGYMGKLGVSLFLIISGASLMYVYGENFKITNYIKNRFFAIYPAFWMSYIVGFIYFFCKNKSINNSVPKINFIFTLLGLDGYVSWKIPTFYILGEWFLGFILILYICFPILKKLTIKMPKLLLIITIAAYVVTVQTYNSEMKIDLNLFARLPEFLFGIYFVKYIKKIKPHQFIVALLTTIISFFIKIDIDQMYKTTICGILLFVILAFIAQNIRIDKTKILWVIISKYSFEVCLVHHVIIYEVLGKYYGLSIAKIEMYGLFTIVCIIIALLSFAISKANNAVKKQFKK